MSKKKSTSSSTINQTQTPNVPGWITSPYRSYASGVGGLMDQDASAFAVGASPLQTQAFGSARSMGGDASIGQGITATQGLLGYDPERVSMPNAPSNVTAGMLADADLSRYMNPHTGEVIDLSLADLDRQRQMAISGGQGEATLAGAYGGSRHGVADSLTNEAALREAGLLSSGLRAENFRQAQAAAMGDIGNRLQADLANQQAGLMGSDQVLRAQMANQAAGMEGQRLNLGAAEQLARLGLLSDENLRAIIGQQADLGEMQRGIDVANNPALLRLAQLESAGGLLGQIPAGIFTGQTMTGRQTGTNTESGNFWDWLAGGGGESAGGIMQGIGALMMASDARVKKDISRHAIDENGFRWYKFRGVDEPSDAPRRLGVMAQDLIEQGRADLVRVADDGTYLVDYSRIPGAIERMAA